MADFTLDASGGPVADVPEFTPGDTVSIEVSTDLRVVLDTRDDSGERTSILHMRIVPGKAVKRWYLGSVRSAENRLWARDSAGA